MQDKTFEKARSIVAATTFRSYDDDKFMAEFVDAAHLEVSRLTAELNRQRDLQTPKEKPLIEWELDGNKSCGYNNWLGTTAFGPILITWKGWKETNDACVDEFPGGFRAYGYPDEVKAVCEAEFRRRLKLGIDTEQPKPSKTVWLIECKNGFTGWWNGISKLDCRLFNKDPNVAYKFATIEEAEACIAQSGNSCMIATQHVWIEEPREFPLDLRLMKVV